MDYYHTQIHTDIPENSSIKDNSSVTNAHKTTLLRKYLMYAKIFNRMNLRPFCVRYNYSPDPHYRIIVNHLYSKKIKKQYKFNEADLSAKIGSLNFDSMTFNHL